MKPVVNIDLPTESYICVMGHEQSVRECNYCLKAQRWNINLRNISCRTLSLTQTEIVSPHLLASPRGEQGCGLVAVDKYIRLTTVVYAGDRSTEALMTATRRVFLLFGGEPKKCLV